MQPIEPSPDSDSSNQTEPIPAESGDELTDEEFVEFIGDQIAAGFASE